MRDSSRSELTDLFFHLVTYTVRENSIGVLMCIEPTGVSRKPQGLPVIIENPEKVLDTGPTYYFDQWGEGARWCFRVALKIYSAKRCVGKRPQCTVS